jgi:hypothetical protein
MLSISGLYNFKVAQNCQDNSKQDDERTAMPEEPHGKMEQKRNDMDKITQYQEEQHRSKDARRAPEKLIR